MRSLTLQLLLQKPFRIITPSRRYIGSTGTSSQSNQTSAPKVDYEKYKNSNIEKVLKEKNQELKEKHHDKKFAKSYISRMSPDQIAQIGSSTLLDKQWADRPLGVIKNPHKLTEIELYKTLEKIVELPEKRLKLMLTQNQQAVDEVFIANVIQRMPQFLTATIVNITKTLMLQKDYFKDHIIWRPLEQELYRRRNNLNNEQLATVINAFGVTGNGSKTFFHEMEEIIIDSPIGIENEYLQKILMGYSQVDLGSATLYGHIVERMLSRGLEKMSIQNIVEIARHLSKATNVHKAGYGFYEKMEKHIHKEIHEGRVTFPDLCNIVENILPANIGSNKFQQELEDFILNKFESDNLQIVSDLIKGISLYKIKNPDLENLIYKTVAININEFTLKQLETLIWAFSRNHKSIYEEKKYLKFIDLPDYQKFTLEKLIDRVRTKAPTMKARGVAFAIESIQNLDYRNEDTFKKLERVVLSKLEELIPHYLVKVLSSYFKMGYGSGELYDKLISKIIESINEEGTMKYSDMLRFFEIFPEVSYIYDNSMSEEIYLTFLNKIQAVIKDKKFPTEDLCRVFNILVRISPYQPQKNLPEQQKFMAELLGRLRQCIYDIPKENFASTLSNMIEYQQHEIAKKFVFIVQECVKLGKLMTEFTKPEERIALFWSLMQIEKSCTDPTIINEDNLAFLNDIDPNALSPRNFLLYKQLICLVQMFWMQTGQEFKILQFDKIYERITLGISVERREEFINEDPATKVNQQLSNDLFRIIKKSNIFKEVTQNLSDDLMNLINIACVPQQALGEEQQLVGIILINKNSFISTIIDDQPIIRRTVDLKQDILVDLFGWNLMFIDESDLLGKTQEEKQAYIFDKMGIKEIQAAASKSSKDDTNNEQVKHAQDSKHFEVTADLEGEEKQERKGGRKVRKPNCKTNQC
ncbi:UNKNOWN [Stylonychia lemnae]|uniref:Uncharacterized protein n=1 Tax=Stylonychia lemnae TaxID=5949 RepID=A0A078A811_STYLE|nr:UNKNOWN [Stylonychia lemnae]|eukprot:CDW77722.1 UNKNOWN [Stylonychia lemnae]